MKKILFLFFITISLTSFKSTTSTFKNNIKGKYMQSCDVYVENNTNAVFNFSITGAYSSFIINPLSGGSGGSGTLTYDTSSGINIDISQNVIKSTTLYAHIYVDGLYENTIAFTTTNNYNEFISSNPSGGIVVIINNIP